MSISWGRRERFRFSPGGALSSWVPPSLPAVYSITYKQDPDNKPKAHTVLYFGETSDLSRESINEVLNECVDVQYMSPDELYVFIHAMPGSSSFERSKIQNSLIGDYRPRGNGF
jgi:hypothetical protein